MPGFCQATEVFISYASGGTTATPDEGTNMVQWSDGGTTYIPNTIWQFEDASDPTVIYFAMFGDVDVSSANQGPNGEITSIVNGKLLKAYKDLSKEGFEPDPGQGAKMIIVGNGGRCNAVFALVTHK